MANSGESVHLLVFPYPAQGHIIPILDLTHQLIIRGLTITILVTPQNLSLLNPILSKHPSIQTLILPFPQHTSIPSGVENLKNLPANSFRAMLRAMGELYNPLLHWFKSNPSPPTAILSDFFLGWTGRLAAELGIRHIVFCSSAAVSTAAIHLIYRDSPNRDDPNDPTFPRPNILNTPISQCRKISPIYRSHIEGDPVSEFIKNSILCNLASWGYVFNSFTELERVYLDYLKKDLGHDRVWAVGPLLPPEDDSSDQTERGGSSSDRAGEIMKWLDSFEEDQSVVYVCFGSQAVLTNKQMEELAAGLELSRVRFVWAVKEATAGHVAGDYGKVPDGFEDRVSGRGLVIKGWVPQVLILRHRVVGGFLTHCGWNSVLESLIAGVPTLAWPFGADQHTNARLLVEDINVGVKVCEGDKNIPNGAELARAIVEMMGEGGVSKREKAKELKREAMKAIKEGGSSFKDLDELVRGLVM